MAYPVRRPFRNQVIMVTAEIMDSEDSVESEDEFDWNRTGERNEFFNRAESALAGGGWFMVKPNGQG